MNCFYKFLVKSFNVVYPYKIYGKKNVPDGGAVFVCNHFRAIDPAYVLEVYSKDIKILAKAELFKNKAFGKILKSMGGIPIDRQNPDLKTMLSAIKYVKNGHKLLIFPEGTRNVSGTCELQDLKGGSAFIAIKAQVPIVPIMMSEKGRAFKKVRVMVGKPFYLSDYFGKKTTDEDMKNAEKIVREKMVETQKELFETIGKKRKK